MFSLLRRKRALRVEVTFKTRVERFWEWFIQVAPRFYQAIEMGDCASLGTEVSEKVDELLPQFAWVFGAGDGGRGHSFTLSGEGNPHYQLLTLNWQSRAPKLDGWTFYPSRQPGLIEGTALSIGELVFNPLEFWLTPRVDGDREKVDLTVWHPLYDQLPEKDRWTTLFLFLDEVLGEYGTQQWIGEIKLNNCHLTESMPLRELPAFLKKVEADKGWKKFPPGEGGVVYQLEELHENFLRGDVIAGSTCQPALINEYLHASGELEDPLAGTGADYVFVAFDGAILPQGKQTEARGAIEDALDQALKAAGSGRALGGALGKRLAYIDLLLFDGQTSLEIATGILREKGVPSGSAIHFFAKEERGHRVLL